MPNADDSAVAPPGPRRADATLFRAEAVDAYRNPRSGFEPPELRLTFPALWLWSGLLVVGTASVWLATFPIQSAHDIDVTALARCANETVELGLASKPHISEGPVSLLIADQAYSASEFVFATKPLRCVQADGTPVATTGKPTERTILLLDRSEAANQLTMPAKVTVVVEESLWSMITGTNVRSGVAAE